MKSLESAPGYSIIDKPSYSLICQLAPTDLAPSQCFGGCRGVLGPFPQPLFIRVSVYMVVKLTTVKGNRECEKDQAPSIGFRPKEDGRRLGKESI